MSSRRSSRSPLICRICGDIARGLNFDVITCMSCKAFFRRNALRPTGSLKCPYSGDCHVNKENRMRCSACRLKKCLIYGMKPQLIRSFVQTIGIKNYEKEQWLCTLPLPQPVGYARNDRSVMENDQWALLSNIIHAYDAQDIYSRLDYHLKEQLTIPIKLRSKPSLVYNCVYETLSSLVFFIRKSSHFQLLSLDTRRRLLKNNIFLTNCVDRLLITREMDLMRNVHFYQSFEIIYGTDYTRRCAVLPQRIDSNGVLIKIILFALFFSSNCSIVLFDRCSDLKKPSEFETVLQMQDLYVTLLWKYLVHQYGQTEAVLRYSSLVKITLDIFVLIEDFVNNDASLQIINQMIDRTQDLLLIDE